MLLLYARISTAEQNEASITEQVKRCQYAAELANKGDRFASATYIDRGVSASIPFFDRPAGAQLIVEAARGDIIVVAKMDRIFRSGIDALSVIDLLRRRGIDIIICDIGLDPLTSSPAANFYFTVLAGVAQFERERIKERIGDGKAAKKAKGGFIGGNVPFGYRKEGVGRQTMLLRDAREQEHIVLVREMMAAGKHPKDISITMAERGMLGRNGEPYTVMAVSRMARWRPLHGDDLVKQRKEGVRGKL